MKLAILLIMFSSALGAPAEKAPKILHGDLPVKGTTENPLILISGTQKLPDGCIRKQKYDKAINDAISAGKHRFIIGAAAGVDTYVVDKLLALKSSEIPYIDLTLFEAQKLNETSRELEPFSAAQILNHQKEGINRLVIMEGGFRDRAIHMMDLANEVIGFADGLYDFGSVTLWSMILDFARSRQYSALSSYDAFNVHCKALQGIRENYKEKAGDYVSKVLLNIFGGNEGALECLEYLEARSIDGFKEMVNYVKELIEKN